MSKHSLLAMTLIRSAHRPTQAVLAVAFVRSARTQAVSAVHKFTVFTHRIYSQQTKGKARAKCCCCRISFEFIACCLRRYTAHPDLSAPGYSSGRRPSASSSHPGLRRTGLYRDHQYHRRTKHVPWLQYGMK